MKFKKWNVKYAVIENCIQIVHSVYDCEHLPQKMHISIYTVHIVIITDAKEPVQSH